MSKVKELNRSALSGYWRVFCIVFVIFSLYLMGDAFYRWDGFSYYGTFTDYLPGLALVSIIWGFLAMLTTLLMWMPIKLVVLIADRFNYKIHADFLLTSLCSLMFLSIFLWIAERSIFNKTPTPSILIIIIIISVVLTSFTIGWLFRSKLAIIFERLIPLVWIYGIVFTLSIPLLIYHMWNSHPNYNAPKKQLNIVTESTTRPNILLVSFDALTARKMSTYGYYRETTPFITKWAQNASIFTMAEAESTYTAPTTASMMTGKRVWTHQLYQPHGYKIVKANIENLPLVLKNNGYYNMALIQNIYASVGTLDIADSFDVVHPVNDFIIYNSILGFIDLTLYKYFSQKIILYDWIIREDFIFGKIMQIGGNILQGRSSREYSPSKVFNKFLWLLKNKPPEPFFAWIHIMPPHDPYLPPEPYMGMFDPSSKLSTFKSQTMINKYAHIDSTRARYDEFIRFCDKEFEDFIQKLESQIDNTVIILSADHGESFEHNYIGHGGTNLYEEITNIPLIIKEPYQSKGRVFDNLVEQVDIAPSILELADISIPLWMEGRSLVPIMRDKAFPPKPILSMSLFNSPSGNKITGGAFAIWEGNYKLIHYLKENRSLLFNLRDDPYEMCNLFHKETDVGNRLLTILKDKLKKANDIIDVVK